MSLLVLRSLNGQDDVEQLTQTPNQLNTILCKSTWSRCAAETGKGRSAAEKREVGRRERETSEREEDWGGLYARHSPFDMMEWL